MKASALLLLPVQLQIWLVTLSAEQQISWNEQINVLLLLLLCFSWTICAVKRQKKKSFSISSLDFRICWYSKSDLFGISTNRYGKKKSIPFPSVLLSFLCQKLECWIEVRTMSNLPENLPVLCHPVNRWFSSLVWFCKNSLQQQTVGFAKLFHLQWAWKQLPR